MHVRFYGCNAKCKFCEYANTADKSFDIDKYLNNLKYIQSKIVIRKINFTGGEPTLDFDKFRDIFIATDNTIDKRTEITINTNGIHIEDIVNDDIISNRVNNISLSRHHYEDNINNEIFGTPTPSKEKIKSLQSKMKNKDVLNLSCNLMNGYIDNRQKVYDYLDHALNIGIKIVGFVSLMPVNEFCIDNFINFNKLGLKSDKFLMTKAFRHSDACKCNNYVYFSDDADDYVRVYYKNTYKPDKVLPVLVFDGKHFTVGYNGDVID